MPMEGVWDCERDFLNFIIICKRKDIDSISTYLFLKSIRVAIVFLQSVPLADRGTPK